MPSIVFVLHSKSQKKYNLIQGNHPYTSDISQWLHNLNYGGLVFLLMRKYKASIMISIFSLCFLVQSLFCGKTLSNYIGQYESIKR